MISHVIKAKHLSARLKLKSIAEKLNEPTHSESTIELVYKYSETSYVFIFHFGSIVFFNVPEEQQNKMMRGIHETLGEASFTTLEDFIVEEDRSLPTSLFHETGFNKVRLKNLTFPVLRLLVLVIAESAALDYFEAVAEDILLKSRKIATRLKQTGRAGISMKSMVKFIGDCLSTKQEIIADLYVVDAPDETWDDQVLDRLFADMKRLFEIETRYKVLEFKLQLVHETVDVIVELLRFRQQTLLELIIIALIAIEVIWFMANLIKS